MTDAVANSIRNFKTMGYSRLEIAKALNAKGLSTPRGKTWTAQRVNNALQTIERTTPATADTTITTVATAPKFSAELVLGFIHQIQASNHVPEQKIRLVKSVVDTFAAVTN